MAASPASHTAAEQPTKSIAAVIHARFISTIVVTPWNIEAHRRKAERYDDVRTPIQTAAKCRWVKSTDQPPAGRPPRYMRVAVNRRAMTPTRVSTCVWLCCSHIGATATCTLLAS